MSFTDAPLSRRGFRANAVNHLPRLLLLLAISLTFTLALAWLPHVKDAGSLIEVILGKSPGYRLRISLPTAAPLSENKAARPIGERGTLAKVEPEDSSERPTEFQSDPAHSQNSAVFNDAFHDMIKRPAAKPGKFLAVDYNLAEQTAVRANVDSSDGSLTVQKPLFVNGVNAGAATIRIESGAQVLIATSSVAKALGDRANALPSRITNALTKGSGFIPFYELRSAGIQVEYDAARDRVSFSIPS